MFKPSSLISRRRFLGGSARVAGAALVGTIPQHLHASRNPTDIQGANSLRRHAADAKLLFGFAVDPGMLRTNAAYRQAVEEQCSIIVPENAMKWNALAPTPTMYNFDTTDELITFSERTQIKLRGHTLCWHKQLPDWFEATANPQNARDLLENHIRTVAGRYAGRMHSWDVVNEAIETNDGRADGLRNSPWLRLLGTEYIEIAFRTARDADPTALLTYNDYDLEPEVSGAAKRAAVLMMLRRLKQRNVPIDAVGLQSHLHAGDSFGPGFTGFLTACREMDLQVFLSEMDVNDRFVTGSVDDRDRAVAKTYTQYLDTTLSAKNVTAVLTWGVSDANSWLGWVGETRVDGKRLRPLLLDEKFQPTPSFVAVRDAFDRRGTSIAGSKTAAKPGPSARPLPKL